MFALRYLRFVRKWCPRPAPETRQAFQSFACLLLAGFGHVKSTCVDGPGHLTLRWQGWREREREDHTLSYADALVRTDA